MSCKGVFRLLGIVIMACSFDLETMASHASEKVAHQAAGQPAATALGEVQFENSGAPAAQGPFLEGLAALHNFEYGPAAASFRRAQQVDSAFAMAYWARR